MGNRDNSDDKLYDFRPRIGRTDRARERVASSPLRVATLVRRGHGRLGARVEAKLPPTAGFRPRHNARRVVVKAHLQKLGVTAPRRLPGTCGTSSATASRRTARRACSHLATRGTRYGRC
jgi:hypothetical protein